MSKNSIRYDFRDQVGILEVPLNVINYIISHYPHDGEGRLHGIFFCKSEKNYICIDNTDGECWTEEFENPKSAYAYMSFGLPYDYIVENAHKFKTSREIYENYNRQFFSDDN